MSSDKRLNQRFPLVAGVVYLPADGVCLHRRGTGSEQVPAACFKLYIVMVRFYDGRHPVVEVGQVRVGRGRDDGKALQGAVRPLPWRPESRKGEQRRPLHPAEIRLLPAVLHAPFVVAAGRHQAAPLSERSPEVRFVGEGLGAGVDGSQDGVPEPVRDESPVTDGRFPRPRRSQADHRHLGGQGDIVTAREPRHAGQAVMVCQLVLVAVECNTPAHKKLFAPEWPDSNRPFLCLSPLRHRPGGITQPSPMAAADACER